MKSNISRKVLKIVSSSSKGNAYIYFENILLDVGVSYSKIKRYVQDIKYILLTHSHGDHLNKTTLKKILYENPKIRICCGWFMLEEIKDIVPLKKIFVLQVDKSYIIDKYVITPVAAIHDIPNFGYKIRNTETEYKVFHISDTSEVDHIIAKDYDLYCIEGNYETDESLHEIIKKEKEEYGFSYRERVLDTHLSQLQAINWLDKNKNENSKWCFIHQHQEEEKE